MAKIIKMTPKDPNASANNLLKDLIDGLKDLKVTEFLIVARTDCTNLTWHTARHNLSTSLWGAVEQEKWEFFNVVANTEE